MVPEKVYTQEELAQLGGDMIDDGVRLIEAGEHDKAREIIEQFGSTQSLIDGLEVAAVCNLWNIVSQKYGFDYLISISDEALGENAPTKEELSEAQAGGFEGFNALLLQKNVEWRKKGYKGDAHPLLDIESGRFIEAAFDLVDRGETAAACKLVRNYIESYDYAHDLKTVILAKCWNAVYRDRGLEEWVQLVEETLGDQAAVNQQIEGDRALGELEGFKALVGQTSFAWKHHSCSGLSTVEDDQGVTFVLESCGSGGWLLDNGFYEGDNPLSMVYEPGFWTWGSDQGVPIYCAHCAIEKHLQLKNWGHYAFRFGADPEHPCPRKAGDKCYYTVLKNPDSVPAEEVDRIR